MANKAVEDNVADLLKYLLAIELLRAGLTQGEIRKRLKMNKTTLATWLKGLSKEISTSQEQAD